MVAFVTACPVISHELVDHILADCEVIAEATGCTSEEVWHAYEEDFYAIHSASCYILRALLAQQFNQSQRRANR